MASTPISVLERQKFQFDDQGNPVIGVTGSLEAQTPGAERWKVTQNVVTTTAEVLIASPLEDRAELFIYNNGSVDVYIAETEAKANAGTSVIAIKPNARFVISLSSVAEVWIRSASSTCDVRIIEMGA